MKSLAERHKDRAQRKVDNATESTAGDTGGGVGAAVLAAVDAQEKIAGLTDAQKAEVHEILKGHSDGFEAAEAPYDMAGIGVPNAAVMPAGKFNELSASDAQEGKLPEASFDPENGNLNGQAIEQAGNGWGTEATEAKSGKKKAAEAEAEKA